MYRMVKKTRKTDHNRLKTKTGKKRSTKKKMNQKRKRNNTKRQRKTKRGGSWFSRSVPVSIHEDTHTDSFHDAIKNKNKQQALNILRYKDVNISKVTEHGNTALHLAAESSFIQVVKKLIDINTDPDYINKVNNGHKKKTALDLVYKDIQRGQNDIKTNIAEILVQNGATYW